MAKTVVHEGLEAKWGDEDHLEVSQSRIFTQMIFELLSERKPTDEETKLFDLILNLSIDHGPDSPSGSATVKEAKEGKGMGEAIGEGISRINESHGGAIEPCMENLYKIQDTRYKIQEIVGEYLKEGKRMPGFGHRIYKDSDPRTQLIFSRMKELGFSDEFIGIAQNLEEELEKQKGIKLPVNIDGAIAVALCTFGWEAKLGNAVFIIARTPGLCAQFLNNSPDPDKNRG